MVTKKRSIESQQELDKKPVTGRFVYNEIPGGVLSFPYRKYKKTPITKWDFVDGEVYTIPRGIASHLQTSGNYQVHEHSLDKDGKPSMKIGRWVKRYNFEAISFIDEDDEDTPELYTAEEIPMQKRPMSAKR